MGVGNFRAAQFFFVDISLAGIFFSYSRTSFLGYSLCMIFFSHNVPLHDFVFVLPPHNFSNGRPLCDSEANGKQEKRAQNYYL